MRAIVCVRPGELKLADRSAPKRGDDEALVRPRRVGICGTDYHIYEGKHPYLEYPRVMGHELAVEVVEAPPDSDFAPGDICVANPYISCGRCVACRTGKPNCCVNISVLGVHRDGGMAELLSLPTRNLIRADGLSNDECATVEFLAIGAHAVRRGIVSRDDNVLVVGSGRSDSALRCSRDWPGRMFSCSIAMKSGLPRRSLLPERADFPHRATS